MTTTTKTNTTTTTTATTTTTTTTTATTSTLFYLTHIVGHLAPLYEFAVESVAVNIKF
jgi:hypothetical protein